MAYTDIDTDVLSALLAGAVEQLDIPEELLALADQVYDDIGMYLCDHLPDEQEWTFFPQGRAGSEPALGPRATTSGTSMPSRR